MKTHAIITLMTLSLLTGCASKEEKYMPISILTAEPEHEQRVEVLPIKQIIRPADILEIILHVSSFSNSVYKIQAGDQIDLSFLTASELTSSRLVMPDGSIEMPYVGRINIAGLTTEEAHKKVVAQYRSIIKNPEIVLSIPRPNAQIENLRASLTQSSSGMSRDILVGADGRASFPLIGSLSLQGLTIDEVRDELNKKYAQEFGEIRADVLLKSTAPNQIYILGEVEQPGAFPITRPISVLEAISLARGSKHTARLDSAIIMRRKGNEAIAYTYDIKNAIASNALQLAYLQPDDLLYIPQTRLSKAAEISQQIADVIRFSNVGFSFSYRVDNKTTNNE
ncbi:MAG TPA: polysaccharide biosynthesis protein [Clostridiaceae bacterium]|nr:polysaccharide biosynthesis protein [Clostridiaceae bacterium]